MPDKDRLFAVLQPVGYRWQNDRDGLVEDGTAPACRASAGSSGFHEMNHPVVLARDNAAHAAVIATVDMQACKGNANVGDGSVSPTLCKPSGNDVHAVAFNWQNGGGYGNANEGLGITVEGTGPIQRCNTPAVACPTLTAHNDPSRSPQSSEVTQQVAAVHAASMTVRRLTAKECERLQAFPDDYTLIPWRKKPATECPDGPRYKALGNSMACNCMAWIGERIAAVEARHD